MKKLIFEKIKNHKLKFKFYLDNKRCLIELKNNEIKNFRIFTKDSCLLYGFSRLNDEIFYETLFTGTDCDGKISVYRKFKCNKYDLKKGAKGTPKWVCLESETNDQFAQNMNY